MKKLFWNFAFFCLILSLNSITSLTNKSKKKEPQQQQPKTLEQKEYAKIGERRIWKALDTYIYLSTKFPLQYFLLILSTEENKFPFDLPAIEGKLNVYKFNLHTYSKLHYIQVYLIHEGEIYEEKKFKVDSDEFEEYEKYILNKYKLQQQAKKHTLNFKSFLSTRAVKDEEKDDDTKSENKHKRLIRFIWAIFLVIIFSLALFFLVKYSIDWATSGKNEINKMKEQKFREVTEIIFNKDF